jgi:predicted acyl esterase
MIQSLRRTLALILVGCWSFLSMSHFGLAQGVNKQDVSFTTADGVKLMGTYYPGNKGNNSPTALILHEWGKDRKQGRLGRAGRATAKSPGSPS